MGRFKFWRPSLEREVEEELDFHLAMRARDLEARGLSPDEARTRARQSLGDLDAMRHRLTALGARRDRKEHRAMIWSELWEDVRYGLRGLRRQPGFALGAIVTLALGIGATTAIFSAVYSVVLRPLPFPGADRVMLVAERVPTGRDGLDVGRQLRRRPGPGDVVRGDRIGLLDQLQPGRSGRAGAGARGHRDAPTTSASSRPGRSTGGSSAPRRTASAARWWWC